MSTKKLSHRGQCVRTPWASELLSAHKRLGFPLCSLFLRPTQFVYDQPIAILENRLREGPGMWQSACLAGTKPWAPSPASHTLRKVI